MARAPAREARYVNASAPPNHPLMNIFCDENNDDSICSYYLELQKPAGASRWVWRVRLRAILVVFASSAKGLIMVLASMPDGGGGMRA